MSAVRTARRAFQRSGARVALCFYCNRERWCNNRKGVPVCNGCTKHHRETARAGR